jgi:hypothetical protein
MKDNIIHFPLHPQQSTSEIEQVMVLKCPEEDCQNTKFYLEAIDPQRVVCTKCYAVIREGWM